MTRDNGSGNQRAMRERNVQRFVELLLSHGAGTSTGWREKAAETFDRGAAARSAQLARASIANFETELAGILDHGSAGAKNRPLRLDPTQGVAIGVDFGHRSVRAAIGDLHAQLPVDSDNEPLVLDWDFTDYAHPDVQLDEAAKAIHELMDKVGAVRDDVVGIGISIAAPIDFDTGRLDPNAMPHVGWRRKVVHEELLHRLGWRGVWCRADNDARLSARTQVGWGPGRGKRSMIYVKWAEGIGSGLWLDGRIYRGGRGFAGEIGHIRVDHRHADLRPCDRCNRTDCLEMAAGGIRLWELMGKPDGEQPLEIVIERARADGRDEELLKEAARSVGRALATLATTLEPEVIVLGGTIGVKGYDLVSGPVQHALDEFGMDFVGDIPVLPGKEFGRTAVRGAMLWALEERLATYGRERTKRQPKAD